MAQTNALGARNAFQKLTALELGLRPLGFACTHCQKSILSDMPWRCGYCDAANRRTKAFSFLNKCQVCEREPKSVICCHCEEIVFLDGDKNASNPALRFVVPKLPPLPPPPAPPPPPPESPQARERREHAAHKEKLERQIEIETLNVRLKKVKASGEPTPETDAQAKAREQIEAYLTQIMGLHMAVKDVRKKIEERYKDDPNLLEMANIALEKYQNDRI